jgi:hypothetical protein
MKNYFALALMFIFAATINAQVSTQLATITVGSPNNSAGLGVSFQGEVLADGNLYFTGSSNGLRLAIWMTNGSKQFTSLVVQEASMFGGDWERIIYTKEGVLIFEKNVWKILRAGQNSLSVLTGMPNSYLNEILKTANGEYYMMFKSNSDLVLYTAAANFTDVRKIGSFNPTGSSISTTCGTHGAVTYNTNVFQNDTPLLYIKSLNKIMTLLEFIKTIDPAAQEAKDGYMHDEFLIVNYSTPNNSGLRKIINLSTMVTANFMFFRNLLEFKNYGTHFLMITQEDIIKVKRSDMSSHLLFSDVFAFTPTTIINNKLYIIEYKNNKESIAEIDLDLNKVVSLPNSDTGKNFYSSKFLSFKDEFYYIKENTHQLLMKYDFFTKTSKVIDSLSLDTGATVNHNLFEVNGRLVFSKRLGFLQHEPFVLGDGTTSVNETKVRFVDVWPVPAQNEITISLPSRTLKENENFTVTDMYGRVFSLTSGADNNIDITNLPSGLYFGFLNTNFESFRIKFVKVQ